MDKRIEELRKILKYQIDWYENHKEDEDYVYEEIPTAFDGISRGNLLDIIKIVISDK